MAGGAGITPRVAETTIEQWAKKVGEETERHLPLLALLKKKGRIEYGNSGPSFRWVVRNDEHAIGPLRDLVAIPTQRVNTKTSATLGWRGYCLSDAISLREKLEQGGPEAMIKIFASREELMRKGAIRRLGVELFKDGELPANIAAETFHGIESFMGIGTQVNTAELASVNNSTYAGLSTAVGTVSPEFTRLWTPTIVNTGKVVSAVAQPWSDFAVEYIRKGLLKTQYGPSDSDRPDLIMLTNDAYNQLLDVMDDKERIIVDRGSGIALTQLGFGMHVEIDGVGVTWGTEVPATDADTVTVQGYMFNTNQLTLKIMGESKDKSLFTARTTYNPHLLADEIIMTLYGNLKFESPRHFGKFADISGVAS